MIQAKRHSFLMTFRKQQSNSVKPAPTFISNDSPQETFSLEARHCKNIYSNHLIRLLFHRAEAIKRECSKGPKTQICSPNCMYDYYSFLFSVIISVQFSSVQLLSRVWLFATPWTAPRQASLSITNSRSLLKLMSIESVMPSSHLILCRPLLLLPPIPPSIRVFSNESTLHMRWPEYWSFSFSISPSNEHPGLISFKMDCWISLQSRDFQESSPAPQFKSINSSVLSFLHSPTLTSIHDHWKNHRLD